MEIILRTINSVAFYRQALCENIFNTTALKNVIENTMRKPARPRTKN